MWSSTCITPSRPREWMLRSFASLFAAIVFLGCTALPAYSSVRSERAAASPRRAQAPAPAPATPGRPPGGPAGAPNQPGGGGNAVVIESGRSYVVEIVIIVAVCGAALWAVCKSANRV